MRYGHALVTGGAGFIGSHLVERLLREGIQVTVLDNLSVGTRENVPAEATFMLGDVRDPDIVAALKNNNTARVTVTVVADFQAIVSLVPIQDKTIVSSSSRTILGIVDLD